MPNLLLTGTTVSFFITFFAVPAVIRVADEKSLFDKPDSRKLHTKSISSLGGVGIFIGFFLSALLFVPSEYFAEFQFLFAAAFLTFFLGIKDDILVLSASKKFLGQLAAAAVIIHLANVRIDSMHGFLGMESIPDFISYPLSYMTIIVVMNAYNLIDGVDGLAGTLGLLTTTAFGAYFAIAGVQAYALLAFSMTGAIAAFLAYNYHPAKIFMGDSGSLLLGLLNSILVIKFINTADGGSFPITSGVAIGFSILMVPLMDTLRVFSVRIAKGRSPFSPDRNHIHHLLLDRGLNHSQVTHICVLMNIGFILVAYFGRSVGNTILVSAMIATSFALIGVLKFWRRRPMLVVASSSFQQGKEQNNSTTKVVSFKNEEVAVAE